MLLKLRQHRRRRDHSGPEGHDCAALQRQTLPNGVSPTTSSAAVSIGTLLRRLVAYCMVPVVASAAVLWLTDPSTITALGMASPSAGPGAYGGWPRLACAAFILSGFVAAQSLARQIMDSIRSLAELAARLADGLPAQAPRMLVTEAEEVAETLIRVTTLLRMRTAQRDRAAQAHRALRRAGQHLQHLASHDELTGLINRRHFDTTIGERVAACDRGGAALTLLYIDVDGFKRINDRYGHTVGDELLRLFAARVQSNVRDTEVVARLGGDEFAVILNHAVGAQSLDTADRLIDHLSRPYRLGNLTVEVSASIGLAAYPGSAPCARTLLQAADAAMYLAKNAGKRQHATSGFGAL